MSTLANITSLNLSLQTGAAALSARILEQTIAVANAFEPAIEEAISNAETATTDANNASSSISALTNTETLGATSVAIGTNGSANRTYAIDQPFLQDGVLSSLSLFVADAGVVFIKRLSNDGSGNFTLLDEFSITVEIGENIFSSQNINGGLPFFVRQGDYLGFWSATVRINYINETDVDYYDSSANVLASPVAMTLVESGRRIQLGVFTSSIELDNSDAVVVGYSSNGVGTSSTASVLSVVNRIAHYRGVVDRLYIEIGAVNSGAIKAQVLQYNYDGTFDLVSEESLAATSVGINIFNVEYTLSERQAIAIQTVTGGATLKFLNTGGNDYFFFLGTASGDSINYTATINGRIFYSYSLLSQDTATALTASNQFELETQSFVALPDDWEDGTWTFDGTKASSGSVGIGNQLRTYLTYGLDKRVIRWEFEFTNAETELVFVTNPIEGGITSGSQIILNTNTNNLERYTRYNGVGTSTLIGTESLGFTVGTGKRYVLEWEKNGREYKVRLWNKNGSEYFEYARTAEPFGYTTYPSFGYDQGVMQGAPGISVKSGSADVYLYSHYGIGSALPKVFVLGDSITEGFTVTDTQKYPALLADEIGDVIYSGIGGATSAGILLRILSEVSKTNPDYVFVFIGTNTDSSLASNYRKILHSINYIGASLVVCTIPSNLDRTTIINALPSDVSKVLLDLALTNTGAGSGVLATFYDGTDSVGTPYNDGLHPNSAGHIQIARRVKLDTPIIFRN
jgi:hypothetical protein